MMKILLKRTLTGIFIIISLQFVFSQEDSGQPGTFLRYGIGGRALGMGRSFISLANDASGVFWNPAGIIAADRIELTSMYTNLYYDSRFSHVGFVIPRMMKNSNNFFLGSSSSIGFGWVGLASTGYEQRNNQGIYLGDFGFNENAFVGAWAREEITTWGILSYGFNLKLVNQNISDLQSTSEVNYNNIKNKWSYGADIGLIFQPIHAPIFNLVSLRYLLPLRLGFAVQNIIRPGWSDYDDEKDYFPVVFRGGLSYKIIFKDWIPISWKSMRKFFKESYILTSLDYEYFKGSSPGYYFGMEGFFPLLNNDYILYPRMGLNNRTEDFSLGLGLSIPFAHQTSLQVDYSYCYHPTLPEDNRFFLTFKLGNIFNPVYFFQKAEDEVEPSSKEKDLIRVIAQYPNNFINQSIDRLVEIEEDSLMLRRYYYLRGGIGKANLLVSDARKYLRRGKIDKAKSAARDAVEEYTPIYNDDYQSLTSEHLIEYAEVLIISNQINKAINVLDSLQDKSLKTYYLLGVCHKEVGNWDSAITMFSDAIRTIEQYDELLDYRNMVTLSFLSLGETLLYNGQYESAFETLSKDILDSFSSKLHEDYPRYPIISDQYIADDVQFLKGISFIMRDEYIDIKKGVSLLLETQKLYPFLDFGEIVEEKFEKIIKNLKEENWIELKRIASELMQKYSELHSLVY
ncbi:MAG: UPF0164 family protein [bacterium]